MESTSLAEQATDSGFGLGRREVAVRHIMEQVHDVDFSLFRMP